MIAFHKRPRFSARTIFDMARRMRSDGVEVTHTHNWVIHHYGAAAAAIARAKAVVNTQHGLGTAAVSQRQARLFRAVGPLTRAVVFVAEEARGRFCAGTGLNERKARVIRNGIALDRFLSRPASPGTARPRIRFGTVGRMVPVKDHATLLRALATVSKRLPDCELRIMRYGPLRDETVAAV